MKRILIAIFGMTAMAGLGTASAADLPRQAPVYKAPPYIAPVFNWTGFYVGLNGGGAWGKSKWTGIPADFDVSGGLVGGTVGYNWQFGTWVLGIEGDADWASIKGNVLCPVNGIGATCETKNDFLATIRGRVGYAFDRWLPYVTAGAAFGTIKASSPGYTTVDDTNAGWTVGAGMEYSFAPNWSAKVEYLYVDLGSIDCGTAALNSCNISGAGDKVDFRTNVVRGGINYRF